MASSTRVNEVHDEKFEEIYRINADAIELLDNGRVYATVQTGSFACALGKHNYSSGVHRIRLRCDYGIAVLGIRSRNIPPVADEFVCGRHHCSPSTYAWTTNGNRIINGAYVIDGLPKNSKDPLGFVLTVNCDEHKVSIIDESINNREEMDVDLRQAPLPWCLFVELWRGRSRMSLVSPPSLTFTLTSAKTEMPAPTTRTSGQVLNEPTDSQSVQLSFFQDVELWREEAYRLIDQYCENKREAFHDLLSQQQTQAAATPDRLVSLETVLSSLTIDDDRIQFRSNRSLSKSILPLESLFVQALLEENHGCVAANSEHFTTIQGDHLFLYQLRWPPIRTFPWTYGTIHDMFWCQPLDQFIFIAEQQVLIFSDKTMIMSRLPVSDDAHPIDFYGGTCVGDTLFLFTWGWGPSIYVYALRPSLKLTKTYQPPCPCATDELILHCASNSSAIALVIKDRQDELRLDLCSPVNLEQFWSVKLDLKAGDQHVRCCSVHGGDWLVVSPDHSTLVHISADGELLGKVVHQPSPWYALSLAKPELLILYESSMHTYMLP